MKTNHYESLQLETPDYVPKEVICIKALIGAVLERAIDDYHKGGELSHSASRWIVDDEIAPMSFTWCCQMLDQCPCKIRRCILEKVYTPPLKSSGRSRLSTSKKGI